MGSFPSKQSKKEIYYEKLLTTLQNDIKSRQQTIQRLKTFNRSCQVHLVLFSSVFYGGYTVFLLLQYKLSILVINKSALAFLVLFPVGVFYLKKLVAGVFGFLVGRRQNVLKAKQTELKDRIEELKVETRYYQTKDLIEKYDKSAAEVKIEAEVKSQAELKTEVTRRNVKQQTPSTTVSTPSTKSTINPRQPAVHPANLSPPMHPLNFHPSPQLPFRSPTWMDRFMDALIGDDSRNQKYALICSQCFNHNGLATPESFETVKYRCPNCGFFNQQLLQRKKSNENKRIQEVNEPPVDKKGERKKDDKQDDKPDGKVATPLEQPT